MGFPCVRRPLPVTLVCALLSLAFSEISPSLSQSFGRVRDLVSEMNEQLTPPSAPEPRMQSQVSITRVPQGQFFNLSDLRYATFSAYRLSPRDFVVVGLGHIEGLTLPTERGVVQTGSFEHEGDMSCSWHSTKGGSVINGTVVYNTTHEPHHPGAETYYAGMLFCSLSLSEDTGSGGGQAASPGEQGFQANEGGGVLQMELGKASFIPYEEASSSETHSSNSTGPFVHQLVFCSPPLYGPVIPKALFQWFTYHYFYPGYEKFFVYDAGAWSNETAASLHTFVDSGLLELVPLHFSPSFNPWYNAQGVAMQDCMFRNRETAAWVAFGDFDEYTRVLLPPPQTLKSFLAEQTAGGVPWVAYGPAIFVRNCSRDIWSTGDGSFAVENAVCRLAEVPEIISRRRKLIVNPRLTELVKVHKVLRDVAQVPGKRLNESTELRFGHFSGIQASENWCDGDTVNEAVVCTDEISVIAKQIRACVRDKQSPRSCEWQHFHEK